MFEPIYNLSERIQFRKATNQDVEASSNILKWAAQQMMDEGKQQWDHTYPTEVHVQADVDRGVGYVLEYDKEIIGYCAIVFDGEPVYNDIQGQWLSDYPYIVVHRMALRPDMKGLGLGRLFMETAERYAKDSGVYSFKVDTNFDNYSMLTLLEKLGFTYCGEIFFEGGSRKAFEKIFC